MKKRIIWIFIFLSISLWAFPGQPLQNRPGLSIKETYEIYIQSILNSDLKTLFTTVSEDEKFFFLTSTGKLIDTREGYYRFHEDWFKEKDWGISFDLLEDREGKDYGYTHSLFLYWSKTAEGSTYFLDSYFTLIFHKEDNLWKVVSDVCTPLSRYYADANPEIKYSPEQKHVLDAIRARRTVRKFQSTPVPKELSLIHISEPTRPY
mgnify:CR=1 FL=1